MMSVWMRITASARCSRTSMGICGIPAAFVPSSCE